MPGSDGHMTRSANHRFLSLFRVEYHILVPFNADWLRLSSNIGEAIIFPPYYQDLEIEQIQRTVAYDFTKRSKTSIKRTVDV